MNNRAREEDNFNSLNILYFIYKWRKPLVIIAVATLIISSIVALTIQEKFKSTVILFPATTSSISKALLSDNGKNEDVLQFGEEGEAEQMLQILNSDEIRSQICDKYNLMQHYGIDSSDKFRRTKLYDEFQSNITFKRTEFMSVKIEVLDRNPDTAALIANDIAALHDSSKIRMVRDRAIQSLKIIENEYHSKSADVQRMDDSIKIINSLGLYDYESQSDRTMEQYSIALSKGDARAIKSLEEKLKIIAQYGSIYVSLRDNLILQRKQLNSLKTKYEEALVDANEILPQKFIVSSAFPAERKSYPVRWIIVLVSTLSTLLISIIVILLIENIRQFRGGIEPEPQ